MDPAKLIFLDESGAKTNMTRLRGRALRGQRVHAKSPHGHWRTTTMLCAIRMDGSTACMAVDGPTDTEVFRAYVEGVLCPTVKEGDMVVMDNLSPHKSEATRSVLKAAGAQVMFLPAYSPDLNPIENMWSKVKNHLRGQEARSDSERIGAIASALKTITRQDATNWFAHCGYSFINLL